MAAEPELLITKLLNDNLAGLGNTLTGSGVAQGTGMDLRRMADGLVQDNTTVLWKRSIGVENIQGTVVRNNKEQ